MNHRWLVAALTYRQSGLSPAARYALARFVQLHGGRGWTPLGVGDFAKAIGISDIQLGRGLNALVEGGVLWRRKIVEGPGRPPSEYCLAPDVVDQLERYEVGTPWEKCIDHLLRHENHAARPSVGQRKKRADVEVAVSPVPKRLSFVNRLLFAVLLCHADRFGIVQGTGRATLGQQTGLSKERLRDRTQSLLDEGALRAYTPGATGKHLFRRTASRYVLNLNHPDLLAERTPLLLSFLYRQPFDGRISDMVDYILKPTVDDRMQHDLGIRPFLRARHEQELADSLRGKLDGYAEAFLSGYWGDMGSGRVALQKTLQRELLMPSEALEREPIAVQETLAGYLIERSHSIAAGIKRNCQQALKNLDLKSMDIALLPERRAKYSGSNLLFYSARVLLLLPKNGAVDLTTISWGGCVLEWRGDDWTETVYPDSAELSVAQQYLYGLRVPPGGVLQLNPPPSTDKPHKDSPHDG